MEEQRLENLGKRDIICKYDRNTGIALCEVSAIRDE